MIEAAAKIKHLLRTKKRIVVAIDGMSGAGKSTLTERLRNFGSCRQGAIHLPLTATSAEVGTQGDMVSIISMDDFFLRPHQRTPERLLEPGGNIDYERFEQEVVQPLESNLEFAYNVYDCSKQRLSGVKFVPKSPLVIIEGVYSQHPKFSSLYTLKIFTKITKDEQIKRLTARNPALLEKFINEWLPMENKYFKAFDIEAKSDIIIEGEN